MANHNPPARLARGARTRAVVALALAIFTFFWPVAMIVMALEYRSDRVFGFYFDHFRLVGSATIVTACITAYLAVDLCERQPADSSKNLAWGATVLASVGAAFWVVILLVTNWLEAELRGGLR